MNYQYGIGLAEETVIRLTSTGSMEDKLVYAFSERLMLWKKKMHPKNGLQRFWIGNPNI